MTTSVSSTTKTSTNNGLVQPEGAVGKKDLQKGDFMTLFIKQLQYQDPMKPMDSYEMASQLAQFSSMEATSKMSDNMEKLLAYQTSQNNLQVLSLLGNEVQVAGDAINVVKGAAAATDFVLDQSPSSIKVAIYDATDKPVWQENVPAQGAGTYKLAWDGKSSSGQQVADGTYHYKVEATAVTGEPLDVTTHSTGKVTGVNFENGASTLTLDNLVKAKVSDIAKVQ